MPSVVLAIAFLSSFSTTLEAGDEAWPKFNPSSCREINLRCITDTSGGKGATATADRKSCEMSIEPQLCRELNLFPGKKSFVDFRKLVDCSGFALAQLLGFGLDDYILDCCLVRHELTHLIEPKDNMAMDESNAERRQVACIRQEFKKHCQGPDFWRMRECKETFKALGNIQLDQYWDGCMAKVIDHSVAQIPDDACEACIAECETKKGFSESLPKYLNLIFTDGARKDWCASFGKNGNTHGCDYYRDLNVRTIRVRCSGDACELHLSHAFALAGCHPLSVSCGSKAGVCDVSIPSKYCHETPPDVRGYFRSVVIDGARIWVNHDPALPRQEPKYPKAKNSKSFFPMWNVIR